MRAAKWLVLMSIGVLTVTAGAQGALVALWTFDDLNDTSSEDATNDALTLTGDATISGGTLTIAGDGAEGSYASFARSDELNFFQGDAPQPFTFWVRYQVSDAGTIAQDYRMVDNYWSDGGVRKGIRFQQNSKAANNAPRIIFGQGESGYSYIADASLNLGAKELWSNMAVTFDGSTGGMLYRWNDGEEASLTEDYSSTGQMGSGLDTYTILFRKGTDAIGVVEELRIYDNVLTQEQLDAIIPAVGDMFGDADGDGDVDDDDLSLLLANWGEDTDWGHGEFSGEPPVNDDDLSLLLANWTGAGGGVPEPATLLLIALGGLAIRRGPGGMHRQ